MATLSDNEVTKLSRLVLTLQGFVDRLKSQGVKLTPEQQAHIDKMREKRRCLVCGLPYEGTIRRGSHHSCYNAVNNDIERGKITEQQAVDEGKWNPTTAKPGRKSKYAVRSEAKKVYSRIKQEKSGTNAGTGKP